MRGGPPLIVARAIFAAASLSAMYRDAASDRRRSRRRAIAMSSVTARQLTNVAASADSWRLEPRTCGRIIAAAHHAGDRFGQTTPSAKLHRCFGRIVRVRSVASRHRHRPPPPPGNDLVVFLRPGPVTWFSGTDDQGTGIDYDLAQHVRAAARARRSRSSPPAIRCSGWPRTRSGATIGAGGIYRPPAASPAAGRDAFSIRRPTTRSSRS